MNYVWSKKYLKTTRLANGDKKKTYGKFYHGSSGALLELSNSSSGPVSIGRPMSLRRRSESGKSRVGPSPGDAGPSRRRASPFCPARFYTLRA
jgi:hypothetical protein